MVRLAEGERLGAAARGGEQAPDIAAASYR
jgi:hypothetical protein